MVNMKSGVSFLRAFTITFTALLLATSFLPLKSSLFQTEREITIIYPNGGETFYQGDVINITWITTENGNTASDGSISIWN